MDRVLSQHLPCELVDIIAKMVHLMNLKEVHEQLIHGVVWILYKGEPSFWVCNSYNRYAILSDDQIWKRINNKLKRV